MASFPTSLFRRAVVAALLALGLLALVPGLASASTPATLRLLAEDSSYKSVTFTTPAGVAIKGTTGVLRLRITAPGAPVVERKGFCVDLAHIIAVNTDYSVLLKTLADDARLGTARYGEAAWLLQQSDALIAAQPAASRPLEAAALQTAVWQLTDQVRETTPTSDAVLNARAAVLRTLAAGRVIGGPLTIAPAMTHGCAGRSPVVLNLTGRPGSSATLAVTGGTGVVSPAEVRFGADGTAQASVTSSTPGTVSVTARSEGGTLTRITPSRTGATTPQETMVLVPQSYSAVATVVFDDCPVIPLEDPKTPTTPVTPTVPVAPLETPTVKPTTPVTPPVVPTPHTPTQVSPRYTIGKTGPAKARAGSTIRYTITVRNSGNVTLRDLTVADVLPQGMSLTGTPAGSRLRSGSLVWTLGSLKAGATRVLHVGVRLDADIRGRRCNRATVTGPTGTGSHAARACTMVTPISRTLLPAVTA